MSTITIEALGDDVCFACSMAVLPENGKVGDELRLSGTEL